MLENCCYDFFELLTLNMARNGLFGELVHAEGAYIHDLSKDWLFNKKAYADMWRLKENTSRNGNLYPTHGLGPVAQSMNINRGDKMDHMVSMSTNDFTLNNLVKEMAAKDSYFNEFTNKSYRGNMNTSLIKTYQGKTLMIQHDVSSPRHYSRIHVLSGTKGSVGKWPSPERIAFGHNWIKKEELDDLYKKYSPPIVNHIGAIAKDVGGHGGIDFIMDWRLIVNGIPSLHFARCLRADRKKQGLLYAGTEYGMYISYDDGANWKSLQLNLPIVPITDLTIKNNDLIVGTQGRSIYILDDLTILQQKNPDILNKGLYVFDVNPAYRMPGGGRRGGGGLGGSVIQNAGMNPPNGVMFNFYMKNVTDSTKLAIDIMDKNKKNIKTFSTSSKENKIELGKEMNQFEWDMNYPEAERVEGLILWNGFVRGPKAAPGNYFAKFKSGNDSTEVPFTILADPNYKTLQAEYDEQFNHLITIRDKSSEIMKAIKNIGELRKQMNDFSARLGKDLPKEVKQQIDTVNKQMIVVEEALHQTKAKSGQDVLNFPIKLDDKLSSIYNASAAGQSGLSRQSKDAYAELVVQIDEQLNKLKKIMNDDVAKLNQMIREKSLPLIGVKKE